MRATIPAILLFCWFMTAILAPTSDPALAADPPAKESKNAPQGAQAEELIRCIETSSNVDRELQLAAWSGDLATLERKITAGADLDGSGCVDGAYLIPSVEGLRRILGLLEIETVTLTRSRKTEEYSGGVAWLRQEWRSSSVHRDELRETSPGSQWTRTVVHEEEFRSLVAKTIDGGIALVISGYTSPPLILAAENGHGRVVSALLAAGARVDVVDGLQATPLHLAAADGHAGIVDLLLGHGASLEARDRAFATPLLAAAANGHAEVVSSLLRSGADHLVRNRKGEAPVHLAARSGHALVLNALHEVGVDLDTRNEAGETPLTIAAEGGHVAAVAALVLAGADLEVRTPGETTALLNAVLGGHTEVARVLLDGGADVESRDPDGERPLFHAARQGRVPMVDLLLRAGADVGARANNGMTPLHVAAEANSSEAVTVLLDAGAQADAKDRQADSPLHLAAKNGSTLAAEVLILAGCDRGLRNAMGATPRQVAESNDHYGVVKAIRWLDRMRLGASVGINMARISADGHESTPGIGAGIHWDFTLTPRLTLAADLEWVLRGSDIMEVAGAGPEAPVYVDNRSQYYEFTLFSASPTLRYAIGPPLRPHFYLLGGLEFGSPQSGELLVWGDDEVDPVELDDKMEDSTRGLRLGLGWTAQSNGGWYTYMELQYLSDMGTTVEGWEGGMKSWAFVLGFVR